MKMAGVLHFIVKLFCYLTTAPQASFTSLNLTYNQLPAAPSRPDCDIDNVDLNTTLLGCLPGSSKDSETLT